MSKKQNKDGELAFFRKLGGDAMVQDVLAYERMLASTQRAKVPTKPEVWSDLGAVLDFRGYEGGMRLTCEHGFVDLNWTADDCLQVWCRRDEQYGDLFSYAVVAQNKRRVRYELLHDDSAIEMRTSLVICRVTLKPFQVHLLRLDGHTLCQVVQPAQFGAAGSVAMTATLREDEAAYGLGERSSALNLRGGQFVLWNTDQPDCNRGTDPLYFNVPFYMGLHNNGAYGVFWDNSARGTVDVGAADGAVMRFTAEAGELRYYLMGGGHPLSVSGRYAELTGKPDMPPLWFLGYHQGRFSYYPQAKLIELADEFRSRNIPCDALYLDIHYMDQFKVFTWDQERFPNPAQLAQELHRRGFKVIPIVDPGVKVEKGYSAFESGTAQDVFLKEHSGERVRAVVWPGTCHFPDFTDPKARTWWAEQLKSLIDVGIDGIWNDMNEPAVFTTTGAVTLPDTVPHAYEARGGLHTELHNVYGMQMARASHEALREHRPGKRPVNITRAGFAGAQRYASSWTGDVSSDWDHLRLSIPMVLNMGISGLALTGPDVGGFRGSTTPELLTRWTQAACLMPFFRNHSAIDTIEQEPWVFGSPYEDIMRGAIELRYRLMPYLYSAVAQCHEYGFPVVRPVGWVEPENAVLRSVDDQYMLGDALLVAPVVEKGAESRWVVLPTGEWYDFWTGSWVEGGQTVNVAAPLDKLPLYVRGGAVLPMWDVMQNLDRLQMTTLLMRVYPGDLDLALYEDAGEGVAYQQGDYRWVYLTSAWTSSRYKLERRVAGRYEPPYSQMRLEIYGFEEEPYEVRVDRQGAPVWFYEDGRIEMTLKDFAQLEITPMIGHDDATVPRRRY